MEACSSLTGWRGLQDVNNRDGLEGGSGGLRFVRNLFFFFFYKSYCEQCLLELYHPSHLWHGGLEFVLPVSVSVMVGDIRFFNGLLGKKGTSDMEATCTY